MLVHHRTVRVTGRTVLYREAGGPAASAVVLLHGFPSSSFMFRRLIEDLADCYHVVAPDLIGFGASEAPPASAPATSTAPGTPAWRSSRWTRSYRSG